MVGMLALGRKSISSRATGTGWITDADCGIDERRGKWRRALYLSARYERAWNAVEDVNCVLER